MNEFLMYGLYGAAIMCLITMIKSLIIKKLDVILIPNTIFGFVCGVLGSLLISEIMTKLYPLSPTLAIVGIVLFCICGFMTTISIVFGSRQ